MNDINTQINAVLEPAQQKKSNKRVIRIVLLVLLPLLVAVIAALFYLHGGRYIATDNAYIKADKVPVSAEVSGTVKTVLVKQFQTVKAGQVLFQLDAEPFQISVDKAQAKLNQVEMELAALKASYHEKQAEITLAKTKRAFALKEKKRQSDLVAKKFVSAAALDQADEKYDVANQQITVLQHDLTRILASLGGSIDASLAHYPSYASAQTELNQARLNLTHTYIKASLAGVISNPPKPGQYLAAGQAAMALVSSEDLWIEANYTETDLTYVHPGQAVKIKVDMYPDLVFKGQVERLSPATGAEFSVLPAQNATGNWVKVVQRLPIRIRVLSTKEGATLRAGLSAEVSIDTGHRRHFFGWTF